MKVLSSETGLQSIFRGSCNDTLFWKGHFRAAPREKVPEKVLTLSILIMVRGDLVLSATWFITNLLNHFMIVN